MSLCYQCFNEINDAVNCPYCGYDNNRDREKYPLALPHGSVLAGRYVIGKVLGQGGFGITYVAQDYHEKRLVAVKEYFPEQLSTRSGTAVLTFSGEKEDAYHYGKECFLAEAKTLSQFIGNPNIVRVYSYFEENNTAYFAMEYIQGVTLLDYVRGQGGMISYEAARGILMPVMDALASVHAKGIIHRDISPDNIYITDDGTIKLIDFGAARYSMGDRSRSLDVVLKHGYAPKEQYARHGRQGSYTDVYSLAATMYRCIAGRIPPDSIDRIDEDSIIPPSRLGSDIPPAAENALMAALAVQPNERIQTMGQFKEALEGAYAVPQRPAPAPAYPAYDPNAFAPYPPGGAPAAGGGMGVNVRATAPAPVAAAPAEPQRKKWLIPVVVSSAVALVAVVVLVMVLVFGSDKKNGVTSYTPSSGGGGGIVEQDDPVDIAQPDTPDSSAVSDTPASIKIASYKDKNYETAKKELESLGFTVRIEKSYSSSVSKDCVISQDPSAGEEVSAADPGVITLTVSRGREHSADGYDQKVVVTASSGSTSGKLSLYNWEEGAWVKKMECVCTVGRNGLSSNYGEYKPITPKGTFRLGFAISAYTLDTRLDVYHATYDTCFVDDPESPLYNTIQESSNVPKTVSTDPVGHGLTNGEMYAQIFIEHNGDGRSSAPSRSAGSAITICGMNNSLNGTGGCIDISAGNMRTLLSLLDPSLDPHIVTKN